MAKDSLKEPKKSKKTDPIEITAKVRGDLTAINTYVTAKNEENLDAELKVLQEQSHVMQENPESIDKDTFKKLCRDLKMLRLSHDAFQDKIRAYQRVLDKDQDLIAHLPANDGQPLAEDIHTQGNQLATTAQAGSKLTADFNALETFVEQTKIQQTASAKEQKETRELQKLIDALEKNTSKLSELLPKLESFPGRLEALAIQPLLRTTNYITLKQLVYTLNQASERIATVTQALNQEDNSADERAEVNRYSFS